MSSPPNKPRKSCIPTRACRGKIKSCSGRICMPPMSEDVMSKGDPKTPPIKFTRVKKSCIPTRAYRSRIKSCSGRIGMYPMSDDGMSKNESKTQDSLFTRVKKIMSLEAGLDTLFDHPYENTPNKSVNPGNTIDGGNENTQNGSVNPRNTIVGENKNTQNGSVNPGNTIDGGNKNTQNGSVNPGNTIHGRTNYNGSITLKPQASFIVDTFLAKESTCSSTCIDTTPPDTQKKIKELERSLHDALEKLIQVKLNANQEKKDIESQLKDVSSLEEEIEKAKEKQDILEIALYNALEKSQAVEFEKNQEIEYLEEQLHDMRSLNDKTSKEANEKQSKLEKALLDALNRVREVKLANNELEAKLNDANILKPKEDYQAIRQKLHIKEKEFYDISEQLKQFKIDKAREIRELQAQLSDAKKESLLNASKTKEMNKHYDEETAKLENETSELREKLKLGRQRTKSYIDKQEEQLSNQRKIIEELYAKLSKNNKFIKKMENNLKKEKHVTTKSIEEISEKQKEVNDSFRYAFGEIKEILKINNDFEMAFDKHQKMVSQKTTTLNQLWTDIVHQQKGCMIELNSKRKELSGKDILKEKEYEKINDNVLENKIISDIQNMTIKDHDSTSTDRSYCTGVSGSEGDGTNTSFDSCDAEEEEDNGKASCEPIAVGKLRRLWKDLSVATPSAWAVVGNEFENDQQNINKHILQNSGNAGDLAISKIKKKNKSRYKTM